MPTNDCTDMVVLLEENRGFPTQIKNKGVDELIVLGNVKPKYDIVKSGIVKIEMTLEDNSVFI